tara:strand:+ start:354 stop:731 length:378 start_codon:yes stop_codon:yes gene_type:complete
LEQKLIKKKLVIDLWDEKSSKKVCKILIEEIILKDIFHFHYDWEFIEIVKNKVIFKHKISNKMLEFEDLSNGEIKYYYGQEKPFIQGFTSDYEHHKIKVPTIEIINTFKDSGLFICSLSATNNIY